MQYDTHTHTIEENCMNHIKNHIINAMAILDLMAILIIFQNKYFIVFRVSSSIAGQVLGYLTSCFILLLSTCISQYESKYANYGV